ncbi:YraN family protein [Flavobacterium agricola]|uniref:UPF0102 protein K5I29_10195 n=1 Tax=Flavobacterium agricola TaxID=2870839 RepID=A0ABY6LXB6_9FLAO|nr:YraN family protein [Flavobacterium agricola]UYW00869.1 YraN family protein [Flavobacterium agricola]
MAKHNEIGLLGEQLAVAFLVQNEYEVLEKNWRFKKAEVDIIAKKQNQIICVEVKTRTSVAVGEPESFVSQKKIELLLFAMNQYLTNSDLDLEVRFDIISVLILDNETKIKHIENAFYHF